MDHKETLGVNKASRERRRQRSAGSGTILRPMLLLPLLAVALVRPAWAQSVNIQDGDEEAKKKAVLSVESELNQALLNGDTKVLGRIYADDFAYTNASGEMLTKAQVLDGFGSGRIKLLTLGRADIRLYVFGNTVILNGISTATLEYKGKISKGPRRFTNVYVKQDGQWRLVAHSVSNFPKP
jgi:ketosteroid isomerase-like protein